MQKVSPWCGQPSDRGRLKNRTGQAGIIMDWITIKPTVSKYMRQSALEQGNVRQCALQECSTKSDSQTVKPWCWLAWRRWPELFQKRLVSQTSPVRSQSADTFVVQGGQWCQGAVQCTHDNVSTRHIHIQVPIRHALTMANFLQHFDSTG